MIRSITLAVLLASGFPAWGQSNEPVELPNVTVTPDRVSLWIDQLSREIIDQTAPQAQLPRLPVPQASAGDCDDKDKNGKETAMLS